MLADLGGAGTGVALWSGKGQPAVDGVPVSGSSVEGCTLASGFALGQTLYVGPGQAAPQMPPGVAFDLVEGTVPGSGAMLQLAAARPPRLGRPPAAAAPVVVHRRLRRRLRLRPGAGRAPAAADRVSRPPSGGPSRPRPRRYSGSTTAWSSPSTRTSCSAAGPTTTSWSPAARPAPVPIADTQNVLSSAHAALQRSGREVSLVDLGSLNGTHVAGPEATEWTQLEPGVAHPLSDGDRLLLGWTVITFEQPQD